MDPTAFHKKPLEPSRPVSSYIQTSQRKYLNFDFSEMKTSLRQIQLAENPNKYSQPQPQQQQQTHKYLSSSLQDKRTIHNIETNKKNHFRPQPPESKENTDNSNVREKAIGNITSYQSKPRVDVAKHLRQQQQILTSIISNDGKQHIVSRCLSGDQLKKATQNQIVQSNNEKRRIYPLLVDPGTKLLNYEQTKVSSKKVGVVSCYSANTNIGISRNYNQDRVSIILNISKQSVKCSIFAIYDGHGGTTCCDYLRDNLHENIIGNPQFPSNTKQAILNGVKQTQHHLLSKLQEQFLKTGKLDKSGSCGIMALVIANQCFIANIGDSRAVLSADGGRFSYNVSRDHKPIDPLEQKRILVSGGKIYRTQMCPINKKQDQNPVLGPLRVFPGKLSVSRTFGDIEAKSQKLGGNPKVVISDPQIKQFLIKQNHDFLILGCDGIFDKIQSKQIIKLVWETVQAYLQGHENSQADIHQICGLCVQSVMRQAMNRRSLDNLTVVMIAFEGFQQRIRQRDVKYMTTSLKSMKSEKRSPRMEYDV